MSEDGTGPCADGHGLDSPYSVAVSPDGKSVYVASYNSNTVSEDGTGPCADGHGLDSPYSVAISPDDKSVYVASYNSNTVARFNRAA